MKTRRVGRSGLSVSRLGLGTMAWGRDVDNRRARHLLRLFQDAGGTLVDTAPAYSAGYAEELLGALIKKDHHREDFVIATKAGFGTRDGKQIVDTSHNAMLADLADSLRRLGTDYVDLWQVHTWGQAPVAETLAALDQAVSSGMARYVGVCNYVGWQLGTAAAWQKALPNRTSLVSAQSEYSLLARRAEVEVIPAANWHGMGFFPWSPLGRGVLSGKYRHGIPRDSRAAKDHFAWFVEPYLAPRSRIIVEAVAKAASGLGLEPVEVALLWVRDAPGVTAPLLGARTEEQLSQLLALDEKELPEVIVAALDDVTGGPNQSRTARRSA